MKQPNLEAIRRNDRELQSLERLDNLRDELMGELGGVSETIMYEIGEAIKSDRAALIASSQRALIGEQADSQAEYRRKVQVIEKFRAELLDEIHNLQGYIKQGRRRMKYERQEAARQAKIAEARQHVAALGERLGVTIDANTRLKIGNRFGTLMLGGYMGDQNGEIVLYTPSTRARTVITPEELATAKLAPLPQRKAA